MTAWLVFVLFALMGAAMLIGAAADRFPEDGTAITLLGLWVFFGLIGTLAWALA